MNIPNWVEKRNFMKEWNEFYIDYCVFDEMIKLLKRLYEKQNKKKTSLNEKGQKMIMSLKE